MMKHKHALRCYPGYTLDGRKVYVVETDLVLQPDEPGFDQDAFNEFTEAVVAYMKAGDYDEVTMVPVGKKNA